METGTIVKVRLFTYKSVRNYGGRVINPTAHVCEAVFVEQQRDHSYLVTLVASCAGYPKGHKIAIWEKDFNISENS